LKLITYAKNPKSESYNLPPLESKVQDEISPSFFTMRVMLDFKKSLIQCH
jgi:hypothetical protein